MHLGFRHAAVRIMDLQRLLEIQLSCSTYTRRSGERCMELIRGRGLLLGLLELIRGPHMMTVT